MHTWRNGSGDDASGVGDGGRVGASYLACADWRVEVGATTADAAPGPAQFTLVETSTGAFGDTFNREACAATAADTRLPVPVNGAAAAAAGGNDGAVRGVATGGNGGWCHNCVAGGSAGGYGDSDVAAAAAASAACVADFQRRRPCGHFIDGDGDVSSAISAASCNAQRGVACAHRHYFRRRQDQC